jgi:hypothetical protein
MNRWITLAALCVLLANTVAAQTQMKKDPASKAGSEKPKFKAIFEPVNYPQDSELRDVFFVSADVGWVAGMTRSDAGEGGMILHTADGGQQHSGTRAFEQLYFLDATDGPRRMATVVCSGLPVGRPGKTSPPFRRGRPSFSALRTSAFIWTGTRFFAARMADAPGPRFTLAAPESR